MYINSKYIYIKLYINKIIYKFCNAFKHKEATILDIF